MQEARQTEQGGSPADVYESLDLGSKKLLSGCSTSQPRFSLKFDWVSMRWKGISKPKCMELGIAKVSGNETETFKGAVSEFQSSSEF